MPRRDPIESAELAIRAQGLAFPETTEEFPWGHRALKVHGRSFCFLSRTDDGLNVSVKLPSSGLAALSLPFASPTGYGLGRSGWVTARFERGQAVPLEMLALWLEESYQAIAPKRLAAAVAGSPPPRRRRRAAASRR